MKKISRMFDMPGVRCFRKTVFHICNTEVQQDLFIRVVNEYVKIKISSRVFYLGRRSFIISIFVY